MLSSFKNNGKDKMLKLKNKSKEVKTMKKVFVSYHFTSKDGKFNGFGNYVGGFNSEDYMDDLAMFILDVEDTIAHKLKDKLNMEVAVKVMYFR